MRDLASSIHKASDTVVLVGLDISLCVCEFTKSNRNCDIQIVNGTLLAPPFRPRFDLIIDVSTVDHMPERLRSVWLSAETNLLQKNGKLLISFDSRLNLFNEVFHRLITCKLYPEWTLMPNSIRCELRRRRFGLLREHAVFVAGVFWGTHNPIFPLARILKRKRVFELLKRIELSKWSRLLSFVSPQYVIVAEKLP